MSAPIGPRSAFVPHDLEAPLIGRSGGVLSGFTAAVKDMYDIAGYRAGGGSPAWLASGSPATANAAAVERLLDAGATIVGKTVCDEFFYSITGANAHYGTPLNPRAPERLPGGSSSGSASACASGACDVALGSDTGGSVRIPAALCGLYGLRVTRGRIDLRGAMAMAPSFDAGGWFATAPGLFRRAGEALLEGGGEPAEVATVVLLDDAFDNARPDLAALLRAFLESARAALPHPAHTRASVEGFDTWRDAMRVVQAREVWINYGEFAAAHAAALGPGVKERMAVAASITGEQTAAAREVTARATARMEGLALPGTVLVLPSAPDIAPMRDADFEELEDFRVRVMRLACMASISGLPQVTLPVGTIRGCPVGLSFIGWRGGDEALLDLAGRLAPFVGFAR